MLVQGVCIALTVEEMFLVSILSCFSWEAIKKHPTHIGT